MARRRWIACAALLALGLPGAAVAGDDVMSKLTALEGEWILLDDNGGETGVVGASFRLTSAGSAVMERMFPDSPDGHEMVNMYHADGERVLMTHYCAAGKPAAVGSEGHRRRKPPGVAIRQHYQSFFAHGPLHAPRRIHREREGPPHDALVQHEGRADHRGIPEGVRTEAPQIARVRILPAGARLPRRAAAKGGNRGLIGELKRP